MSSKLTRRIDALEQCAGMRNVAYAVGFTGIDGCQDIEICGTGDRMTVAEFAQRYPAGVIVKVMYEDLWDAR